MECSRQAIPEIDMESEKHRGKVKEGLSRHGDVHRPTAE